MMMSTLFKIFKLGLSFASRQFQSEKLLFFLAKGLRDESESVSTGEASQQKLSPTQRRSTHSALTEHCSKYIHYHESLKGSSMYISVMNLFHAVRDSSDSSSTLFIQENMYIFLCYKSHVNTGGCFLYVKHRAWILRKAWRQKLWNIVLQKERKQLFHSFFISKTSCLPPTQ